MAWEEMLVVISSYQRRELLLRLLRGLDEQFASSPELARGVEVVVVLDGSTDGSREAVEAERWTVPLQVCWRPNGGLSAARNAGLALAGDRIVWFLDDDLVPAPGLVEHHRSAHEGQTGEVVMGRVRFPPDPKVPPGFLRWWEEFYEALDEDRPITRFDQITMSNTSAPAGLLTGVGGFDEDLRAYGMEDYELAFRLLEGGAVVRYAPDAVVWHPDLPDRATLVRRERGLGRNAALIAIRHPATRDLLFPLVRPGRPWRLLRRAGLRDPRAFGLLSAVAYRVSRGTRRLHPRASAESERVARAAARAAGVAEGDPSGALLSRVLGGP